MIWENRKRKIGLYAQKRYSAKGKIVLQKELNNGEFEVRISNGSRHKIVVDNDSGAMHKNPWKK